MYTLGKSTRMHALRAEIIPINRIARSCHLVPLFGRVKEPLWTSENVADVCRTFLFNHYFDYYLFAMVKAQRRQCL